MRSESGNGGKWKMGSELTIDTFSDALQRAALEIKVAK